MTMPIEGESPILDVTCTACGCLCDDIALRVQHHRITASRNACPIGTSWFLADHSGGKSPGASIDGKAVSVDQAIGRAADILRAARSPLILGLTQTTVETQSLAVALADEIGATIDPAHSSRAMARLRAVQEAGFVSATLGEVKDRGDVIVFWGVDPMTTHPRHFERYSVEPTGRFVTAPRTVIVVDSAPSETSAKADLFVQVAPEAWEESLVFMRAIVRGIPVGEADPRFSPVVKSMKQARYGAFFFGARLQPASAVEAALTLVRDLNLSTRFVAMTLGESGNAAGIEAVLASQAGSPLAIDFQAGFPRFLPDEATAELRLVRHEADAALIVADDPRRFLSRQAAESLARIPTVRISPDATSGDWAATVALASATYGIHTGGTVARSDGISLPLRPSLTTTRPFDGDLLAAILRNLLTFSPHPGKALAT